ncbi:MAG: protein-L-isoaspartate(D-aspartate) O-methyltransferase [Betaproteobacteria bacterium]|nr:MAG: protein-L-isoaspartate(D-aspartate) O-methyltransferase [Betaproteobacteria bacterium]
MNLRHSGIGMTSKRTRQRMVERLRTAGIKDETVLSAMLEVPRHLFVDEALASRAYEDVSLPIGFGQTISHPYAVARLCEIARDGRTLERVLEIGTGCGYQAAVLSRIAKEVYSVERVAPLLSRARVRLRELRYRNVRVKHADGQYGLESVAPFDAIVMAAASAQVPDALTGQLAPGGRLILPIGVDQQRLLAVTRTEAGLVEESLDEVKFVPMLAGTTT